MRNQLFNTNTELVNNFNNIQDLIKENQILRQEIRVVREAADITANLVVKQFEETEKILHRFQTANAQRTAVLNSASQISIIATNSEGIIIVFNTGAENLLGYKADEIIGKKTPEIFHLKEELKAKSDQICLIKEVKKKDKKKGLDVFFTYAIIGLNEREEWTYVRKDGSRFPVHMSINPLKEADGSVSGFLMIANDVTEKKRSEKALKESEKKYRLLINNIPNIIFNGYFDGSLDFIDNKIETLTGYPMEKFLSREITWFDLVLKEDIEPVKNKFTQALNSTDKSYLREYRIRAKNGRIVWIEEDGQIICDKDGNIEFVTGAFLDISERKEAEQALHLSEEKYRSLFDNGPDPILVLENKTMNILDANPSALETYGYLKDEITKKSFKDLGTPESHNKILSWFENNNESNNSIVISKAKHYKKNNMPFFVKIKATPAIYKDKKAVILAINDITEMLEKDAQLIQANKMTTLGEMSSGIAHELNQPLNTIKIGNEFIKMMIDQGQEIPQESLMQVVTSVTEQVERASDIINRLREFGRKAQFVKRKIDIDKPLSLVVGIIAQQLNLFDITLEYNPSSNLPPILADNNRIEQVFFNLINNAKDAINQKTETDKKDTEKIIKIDTFMEENNVVVMISDTGTGIPSNIKDKIFEPFFTTKEVGKGMGLGLSIIYGIIRDHDGTINVFNNEYGGTVFKITFPVSK